MSVGIKMCGMLVNGLSVPLRFNLGLCTAGVWPHLDVSMSCYWIAPA